MKGGVLERGGRSYVLALGEGAVESERTTGAGEETTESSAPAAAEDGPKTDEQRLVGTWKTVDPSADENITLTLSAGGTGSVKLVEGGGTMTLDVRWKLQGIGKIELSISMPGVPEVEKETMNYRFESDRVLYITDSGGGNEMRLVRQ